MKKTSIILILIAAVACNSPKTNTSLQKKKDKLAKMEGKLKTLEANINTLKAEIDKLDTSKKDNTNATTVDVETLKSQPFTHFVEVQGVVDSDHNLSLSPQQGGTVEAVYVRAGDRVKKGQVLIQVNGQIIQRQIASLQSSLDFATKMFNKQKALWDQKIGSEAQYLKAKNAKENLEKQMATLQQQYAMTQIKSPINGTIDKVNTKIGEIVAPGMSVVQVVNLSEFKVVADVAETYAGQIETGNKALIFFPDLNKEIKTSITYAGNVISPIDRTFHVEARLGKVTNDIKPNMLVVLKVEDYHTDSAIVVPINAIQHGDNGDYVMVAEKKDGQYVAQNITVATGKSYDGNVIVTKGLKAGDKLITFGYQNVGNGQAVKF